MPELPEVETIKNDLNKKILRKKIVGLEVRNKKSVMPSLNFFSKTLVGLSITKTDRIGKLLIFHLSDKNNFLLIHLKMTGQLIYLPHPGPLKPHPRLACLTDPRLAKALANRARPLLAKERELNSIIAGGHFLEGSQKIPGVGDNLPNEHTRIIFYFLDKSVLYFNDLRKFGYARIVNATELSKIKKEFGIEPLNKNFSLDSFKKTIQEKKTNIKAVLINQKFIAGIGNIYADEILFTAGVRPIRLANKLTRNEIKKIFQATNKVIKKAIKHRGTTFRNFLDSDGEIGNFSDFLKVYGRAGKNCRKCRKGIIKKIKLAGRGTHYCPNCQV
ncbi:MAG: bifunctional DNA-formamidopyrimidine glycosylase/DNA-(apurinic or apyrimidinic site) lyase [Patescibacteria group bacterium]